MRKIVLSGPNRALRTELQEAFYNNPDVYNVPEAAITVIGDELEREKNEEGYIARHKETNFTAYGKLIIGKTLGQEKSIPLTTKTALINTGLCDLGAHARLNKCEFLLPKLKPLIDAARYSLAVICDPVLSNEEELHSLILDSYREAKIPTIKLPSDDFESSLSRLQKEVNG